jgi:hypothetical protein
LISIILNVQIIEFIIILAKPNCVVNSTDQTKYDLDPKNNDNQSIHDPLNLASLALSLDGVKHNFGFMSKSQDLKKNSIPCVGDNSINPVSISDTASSENEVVSIKWSSFSGTGYCATVEAVQKWIGSFKFKDNSSFIVDLYILASFEEFLTSSLWVPLLNSGKIGLATVLCFKLVSPSRFLVSMNA